MTDLSHVIRWNAGFVRGLAQSVLDRAKSIRTTLTNYSDEPVVRAAGKTAGKKRTTSKKTTTKRTPSRRSKKTDA
jgi:hypothetical protein